MMFVDKKPLKIDIIDFSRTNELFFQEDINRLQ